MIFCENCGNQLEVGQKFCDGCGTAAGVVSQPQPQPYAPPPSKSVPIHTTSIVAKSFRCNSCGNSLEIPKNPRGTVRCPYCKNECVLDGIIKNAEIAAKQNIESGIPLTASPARLHSSLLWYVSYKNPNLPIDFFDKAEVIREEHYCVPGYCFHCNATASFNYDVLNVRSHVLERTDGKSTWEVTRDREEWDNGRSGAASISMAILTSANKELEKVVYDIYTFTEYDTRELIDFESLEYQNDIVTCNSDLTPTVAFSGNVLPYVENELYFKAKKMLEKQQIRDLQMGGASVQKEIVRVFLGLYRIIIKYGDKEYYIWLTGNGEWGNCYEVPNDTQRSIELEKRKNVIAEKEEEAKLIPPPNTGWLTFGIWIGVLGAFFTFGISLIVTIICSVLRSQKKKGYNESENVVEAKKNIEKAKKELEDFDSQLSSVVQQFKVQKRALRGIYENVSGDASAFDF